MADVFFDQDDTVGGLPPDPTRRRAPWMRIVAVLVVVVLVLLLGVGLVVRSKIDPSGPPGDEVSFVIQPGTSTSAVAEALADAGIVADSTVFKLYLRVKGAGSFQAGAYTLRESSAMGDVVDTLEAGPALPPYENLTIPEGLVVQEVAERVGRIERFSADRFLELATGGTIRSKYQPPDEPSLEGFLFPDTYRIEEHEDEEDVLRRMVTTFDTIAGELGYDQAEDQVGYSPYEVLIVASLIEAEAKDDVDRAKIARVIYNRLNEGMTLGIDATFYFVLPLERKGTGLRQSDLEIDSPYNTRENVGLVPTPIAMPGRASLAAALDPEPGPWLYYVLEDERTHAFSESYEEFLRNKRTAEEKGLIP